MRHTPGPWDITIVSSAQPELQIIHPNVCVIAQVFFPEYHNDSEGNANARLIAAAPDLLIACEAMMSELTSGRCAGLQMPDGFWVAYNQMQASIAKAKGETE